MAKTKDGRRNNGKHLKRITAPGSNLVRAGNLVPQKLTTDAWRRMHEEFDFDPLRASVQIAKGEALTEDHPFLPYLLDLLDNWQKRIGKGQPVGVADLEFLRSKSIESLTDSWVSHELRSKHILELMQYIYAKRKSIDHHHSGSVATDIQTKPLTATEIKAFDKTFEKDY